MSDFPKHDFRPLLLAGVSYEGNFNAAELHFECSFQGYPTCLSFLCHLSPGHLATWSAKTIGEWGIPEKSMDLPSESWRPGLSESVIVFYDIIFWTRPKLETKYQKYSFWTKKRPLLGQKSPTLNQNTTNITFGPKISLLRTKKLKFETIFRRFGF